MAREDTGRTRALRRLSSDPDEAFGQLLKETAECAQGQRHLEASVEELRAGITGMREELAKKRGAEAVIVWIAGIAATVAIGIASWALVKSENAAVDHAHIEMLRERTASLPAIATDLAAIRADMAGVRREIDRIENSP